MCFIFTTKVATDALGHFLAGQEPRRFDDGPFPMRPLRLNRVQPGTLDRQETDDDAYALPLLLDLSVVRSDPGAHQATQVPGGVVPHQQPDRNVLLGELPTAPLQELCRHRADWATGDEAQPDFLWRGGLAHQQAITG